MTADEFREIATSFSGSEERAHMGHPDFRVNGKIFASLGPKEDWGMAKLTPDQQQEYLKLSSVFAPAAGKWGEGGATIITLANADRDQVYAAVEDAWRNIAGKRK